MRHATVLLALGLALFTHTGSATADTDSALAALRAELVQRRDEDFTGTLDRTLRRQRTAVLDSLAILDAAGTTLRDDATAAYRTVQKLRKSYPAELVLPETPAADLGEVYAGIFDALVVDIEAARDEVAAELSRLPAALAMKVRKGLDKADAILANLDETNRVRQAKSLVKAAKAVLKAAGRVPGPETLALRPDGNDLGHRADPEILLDSAGLSIDAFSRGGNGFELEILVTGPITGPGDYAISSTTATYIAVSGHLSTYAGTSGTLTVTSFGGGRIAGTFRFSGDLTNPIDPPPPVPPPGTVEFDGSFDASID